MIINNPYTETDLTGYAKGQLHTHTDQSSDVTEENRSPTQTETAYKDDGSYDWVSLTDHNQITADPSVAGILHIDSIEQNHLDMNKHIVTLDSGAFLDTSDHNAIMDANSTGFNFIAHIGLAGGGLTALTPAWLDGITSNCHGVGVYRGAGGGNYTSIWDTVLTAGYDYWGVAIDDWHNIKASQFDKGYVMVNATTPTKAEVVSALRVGDFYSSSGLAITGITLDGASLTVTTDENSTINFIGSSGSVKQTEAATQTSTYAIKESDGYIRVHLIKSDTTTEAWSNPLRVVSGRSGKLIKYN